MRVVNGVVRGGRFAGRIKPLSRLRGGAVVERRTPKKVVVSKAAVKKAGMRATKASAKLEGRVGSGWLPTVGHRESLHREAVA
jgi:hypothetical protein